MLEKTINNIVRIKELIYMTVYKRRKFLKEFYNFN